MLLHEQVTKQIIDVAIEVVRGDLGFL